MNDKGANIIMNYIKKFFQYIKHKPLRLSIFITLSSICLAIIGGGIIYTYAWLLGPPPLTTAQNTIYYSSNGKEIGREIGNETRQWVELDAINQNVIDATLQAEDQHFYSHHGFDIKRITAAMIANLQSFSLEEGASTITQQYARNLFLTHEKTWRRKIQEAFYTIRLELFYNKDTILEGYLNTIYYGSGVYGIEAASDYYFQKGNTELSLAEATLLVGIPNRPSYYSPTQHPVHAKRRQERILASLYQAKKINPTNYFLATREHINIDPTEQTQEDKNIAPYFQDVVMNELQTILNMSAVEISNAGYHVYTTLDLKKQEELELAVEKHIAQSSELQVGAIAMEPTTGALYALIGGTDYQESPYNRATQAKRMAGSTFKPFLYYTALTNGYTAATTLLSQPTTFMLEDSTSYRPSNYNGYYAEDEVTLAQALAVSDNIYAVKTNLFLQPERLIETARTFGITADLQPVPSLALGTASVRVQEMVTAYSMLANGGKSVVPFTIERIETADGEVVYSHPKEQGNKQILDPQASFILTQLMTGMFDTNLNSYMHVTGETIASELTQNYAGKSGTTSSDSWMIGFTPDLVTGVWSGYDDNRELEQTVDQQAAKQIWADMMEGSLDSKAVPASFTLPSGIVAAYVDPFTGELSSAYCKTSRLMYFVEGTEPTTYCSLHLP